MNERRLRLVRWTLRLHPRRWRARYGSEVLDLADECGEAGHASTTRLVAGLCASGGREWVRSLRRQTLPAAVVSITLAVLAGGVLLLSHQDAGSGGATARPAAASPRISVRDGRVVSPAYVPVMGQGTIAGYVPAADLFGPPQRPGVDTIAPVYKADLHTLVGHWYPGVGFVPLGKRTTAVVCMDARTGALTAIGTWVSTPIACPSTTETVPQITGMVTPTAMGLVSGASLGATIRYLHSAVVPAGHVIAVSPRPGSHVPARSILRIESSLGPR